MKKKKSSPILQRLISVTRLTPVRWELELGCGHHILIRWGERPKNQNYPCPLCSPGIKVPPEQTLPARQPEQPRAKKQRLIDPPHIHGFSTDN